MKLFICNKAGETGFCGDCPAYLPHKPDSGCKTICMCGEYGDLEAKCIRYRHPLEVAILEKIAMIRKFRDSFDRDCSNWALHQMSINLLRDILKAGRNAK